LTSGRAPGRARGSACGSALLRAAESAANAGDHSVIQGAAPAGAILRIQKKFDTKSAPICTFAQGLLVAGSPLAPLDCVAPGATTSTPDGLNYTMVVPASNHYNWHVTPSTRPFVATKVTPGGYDAAAYQDRQVRCDRQGHPGRRPRHRRPAGPQRCARRAVLDGAPLHGGARGGRQQGGRRP